MTEAAADVTRKSTEKLRFDRRLSNAEIDEFLASVRARCRWRHL